MHSFVLGFNHFRLVVLQEASNAAWSAEPQSILWIPPFKMADTEVAQIVDPTETQPTVRLCLEWPSALSSILAPPHFAF